MVRRAKCYRVLCGQLYRQSAFEVLLWCVTLEDERKLHLNIHSGIYGHHMAPQALMGKAFRHGFYWPTIIADTRDLIKTCKGCQYYAKVESLASLGTLDDPHYLAVHDLVPDMVGEFKKALGGFDHILVAIDKFTKWIEVRPIVNLKSEQATEFI